MDFSAIETSFAALVDSSSDAGFFMRVFIKILANIIGLLFGIEYSIAE